MERTVTMTASESLIHLTIRIVCDTPHGQSCGTGFFFQYSTSKEGVTIPVIVTNKHVVRGATTGYLVFSLCDDSHNYIPGKNHTYQISNFEKAWIFHPDNNVDLCVLPIHQFYKEYKPDEYNLYMVFSFLKDLPTTEETNEFSHIEDVTIIGYPDGLWDETNNLPLVRKGITASSLHYDFNGTPCFVIDAAIYGGSSGSPVLIYNEGHFSGKDGLMIGTRIKLVGINRAVYLHPITGEITEIKQHNTALGKTAVSIPNGLGIAVHARKLLDFKPLL